MTWSAAPKPPLSPRYGSTTVWTGTSLLVWGGVDNRKGETTYNDGAAYNPATRTWTAMPASPLSPRLNTFAVWTGNQALFWGGDGLSPLMNGATYDPASRTWAMIPPSPLRADPQNRQTVAWTGTTMIVIEGQKGAAYSPADRSWTAIPDLPQVTGWELTATSAAWTGSQVVAWVASESHSANSTSGHATAYTWRPGNPDWTPLPASAAYPWPGRTDAPIGGRLLFMGPGGECLPGSSCPARNYFPGYWFDPSSATWTALPPTFSGGSGPAVWTGSAMVTFATTAGANPPNLPAGSAPADAVAAFDPSTGDWTNMANSPITDLTYATLTWTGHQLIMLSTGGYPNGSPAMWTLS